jgi:hypothetical protein
MMARSPAAPFSVALLLAGASLLNAPVQAQWFTSPISNPISNPSPGVLCDRNAQRCFDNQGASISLTQRYLGDTAGQRLSAEQSGRPRPSEFQLSNGTLCSVPQQTCWSDGSRKRTTNTTLTQQLFGSTTVDNADNERQDARCSLNQQGRGIYDGPCEIRVVSREGTLQRYAVILPDGRRYQFRRSGDGSLQLEDATGTWPVELVDHGYTGVFRWGTMLMVATREHSRMRPLAGAVEPTPGSSTSSFSPGQLLDLLFFRN